MNCELNTGFTLDCKDGIGGLKEIFLVEWNSIYNLLEVDAVSNEIEDLTDAATFRRYQLPTQTGSFEETISFNRDNGTVFYTQTVTIKLHKLSTAKRNELEIAALNRLCVCVRDNNDNLWMCGIEDGMDVSTSTAASGTAFGDHNGYEIAFTCDSKWRARRWEDTASQLTPVFIPFDNVSNVTVDPAY
jgi:hypothetical protein